MSNSRGQLLLFMIAALFCCNTILANTTGRGVGWGVSLTSEGVIVTNISARGDASFALRNDGTIISWGNIANPSKGAGDIVAVSAGGTETNQFGLSLTANGTVLGWTDFSFGQGETPPAGLSNVVAISAGGHNGLALKNDGTVVQWGDNSHNQLIFGPGPNIMAISVGEYSSLALKSNGTAVIWPANPPFLFDSNNIIAIAAGYNHHLGLKVDGTVIVWPEAQKLPNITNAVAIAIGDAGSTNHVLALRNDGTVYAYGDNTYGQSTVPPGLSNVIAITAGRYHSVALKSDGTVVCWGDNRFGQCDFPVSANEVIAVSAGARYNLGLKKDGTVCDFIGNRTLPLGLSNITTIAAGVQNGLALRKNGTVVAWGDNSHSQTNVPLGLTSIAAIAVSAYHSLAVRSNGTVVVWGNSFGARPGIERVPTDLGNVVAVSASPWLSFYVGGAAPPGDFALALKNDGTVVGWGDNNYPYSYQIGPTNVPGDLSNVIAIAAGVGHGLALKNDSTVVGWGYNHYGEATGIPNSVSPYASTGQVMIAGQVLSNVVAIAAGSDYSLALKNDGIVVGWGHNIDGEVTVPPGVSNVVAISAGFYQSLAIMADLKIDSINIAAPGPTLGFHTFAGQQYSIEYSPDITSGTWLPLPGGNVSGTGLDEQVVDSNGVNAQPRFYRLKLGQ